MVKTILKIDGMACGMCEAHVNDAIRSQCKVDKVKSSHKAGTTEIVSEEPLDEERVREAIDKTGYRVLSWEEVPYEKDKEKKKFSLFHPRR